MLTGQPPFIRDSDMTVMFAHANEERPRPSATLPELAPLDAAIVRALAIDPTSASRAQPT